jgi:hypothetical protein
MIYSNPVINANKSQAFQDLYAGLSKTYKWIEEQVKALK